MNGLSKAKYPIYVTLDANVIIACRYDFSNDNTLGILAKYVASGKLSDG